MERELFDIALFVLSIALGAIAIFCGGLAAVIVIKSYRDPYGATAAAWFFWPSMPWLVSWHDPVLEKDLIEVLAILKSESIPFGDLPTIRRLPPESSIAAGEILAKCYSPPDRASLIITRYDIALMDDLGRAFVIGHEMGHAVQFYLRRTAEPCNHWLVALIRDTSSEYFADAIGWYCAQRVRTIRAGQLPLPPHVVAGIVQKMMVMSGHGDQPLT